MSASHLLQPDLPAGDFRSHAADNVLDEGFVVCNGERLSSEAVTNIASMRHHA
jgi:hypothetical protein